MKSSEVRKAGDQSKWPPCHYSKIGAFFSVPVKSERGAYLFCAAVVTIIISTNISLVKAVSSNDGKKDAKSEGKLPPKWNPEQQLLPPPPPPTDVSSILVRV